jgi:hypothetical protein
MLEFKEVQARRRVLQQGKGRSNRGLGWAMALRCTFTLYFVIHYYTALFDLHSDLGLNTKLNQQISNPTYLCVQST